MYMYLFHCECSIYSIAGVGSYSKSISGTGMNVSTFKTTRGYEEIFCSSCAEDFFVTRLTFYYTVNST